MSTELLTELFTANLLNRFFFFFFTEFTITPHLEYGDLVIGYLGIKKLQKQDEGIYWCRTYVRMEEHKNKTRLDVIECNEEV